MSFLKNPGNVYLTLWSLYSLKGVLYPDGSIVNKALMLLIVIVSLGTTYKVVVSKQTAAASIYFRGLNILLLMYTLYGLLLFFTDGFMVNGKGISEPSIYFMEGAWVILMPIYVCYFYTRKGYLTSDLLSKWMVLFLVIAILQYYYTQSIVLKRIRVSGGDISGITNNAGYILLSLIPGMLLFKRKVISYIGIGICVMFVLMSVKRGAIFIAAVSIVLIVFHDLHNSKGVYKIGIVLLAAAGLFVLFNYVEHILANNDYFYARLENTLEGNSSKRDEIYFNFWNIFINESDIFQMIFGRGAMSTIKLTGTYAHNDWLEILLGQGIVGIAIFINYWIRFFKASRFRALSEQSRFILTLILCIFGIKTLFSMSITGMPIYASAILGFALADGFGTRTASKL